MRFEPAKVGNLRRYAPPRPRPSVKSAGVQRLNRPLRKLPSIRATRREPGIRIATMPLTVEAPVPRD